MKWAIFWIIHNAVMQPVDTGLTFSNIWACMQTASVLEMAASQSIHQERTTQDPAEHIRLHEDQLYIYRNSVAFRTAQAKYFCVAQAEEPPLVTQDSQEHWFFEIWR